MPPGTLAPAPPTAGTFSPSHNHSAYISKHPTPILQDPRFPAQLCPRPDTRHSSCAAGLVTAAPTVRWLPGAKAWSASLTDVPLPAPHLYRVRPQRPH